MIINNKHKGRKQDEEVSYWLSYSDMMAGMLLTFVLIIAVMMARSEMSYNSRQSELDARDQELATLATELDKQAAMLAEQNDALYQQQLQLADKDKLISDKNTELSDKDKLLGELEKLLADQEGVLEDLIGVRTELIRDLKDTFDKSELSIKVDETTGAITMDSDILFDSGKSELKPAGETFIKEFMPRYLDIIMSDKYKEYVSEIVLEGHTDTVGDYLYNLDLSQKRAYSVANYVLDTDNGVLTSKQVNELEKVLTTIGKSYSELVLDNNGKENADESRRVEILFRLRDEDMIQEMIDVLNSEHSKVINSTEEETININEDSTTSKDNTTSEDSTTSEDNKDIEENIENTESDKVDIME